MEQVIVEKYKAGVSMRNIARELHIDGRRVRKILLKNNITINKGGNPNSAIINEEVIIKEYLAGTSISILSEKYNSTHQTISNLLSNNGIHIRSLYESLKTDNINDKFFEVIDTEKKAYILGLYYADGSISPNSKVKTSYKISIGFKGSDMKLLEDIKKAMDSKHKILNIKRATAYKVDSDFNRFAFGNKKMFNELIELGMVYKSSTPNIPENLISHFTRGMFDGDGCISISKRGDCDMHMMGTETILNEINELIGFNEPKLIRNIYRIRKSGRLNAIKFSDYIYKDATIYLQRKFDIFAVLTQSYRRVKIINGELSWEGVKS